MMRLAAFRAVRPADGRAHEVISLPYDVVTTKEARSLAEGKAHSFLRVVRSEIEFDENTNPYSAKVYERARDNLKRLLSDGVMIHDEDACLYVYSLEQGGRTQVGIAGRVHADDYFAGDIKKHEFTRPEKEKDRTTHVNTTGANTGPVFLAYRSAESPELTETLISAISNHPPLYREDASDGVTHHLVRIPPGHEQDEMIRLYGKLSATYIADGHHRAASAANVIRMRREEAKTNAGEIPPDWFLAVTFPDEQLSILPYNRIVRDLNGRNLETFLSELEENFTVEKGRNANLKPCEFNFYMDGSWHCLRYKLQLDISDANRPLDVAVLQDKILGPLLGIEDPRTSDRIQFVGGDKDEHALQKICDAGDFKIAFSLHPTGIDQLFAVADSGGVMPPKSTWFDPKLRSGFLVNLL